MKHIAIAAVLAVLAVPAFADEPVVRPYAALSVGTAVQDNDRDNQTVVGGALGLNTTYLRGEIAYDSFIMGDNGGGTLGTVDAKMASAKAYLQTPVADWFVPYVGGGLGYVWLDGVGRTDKASLAYIGAVGASFPLTDNFAFGLGYEYVTTQEDSVRKAAGDENWTAHVLKGTVRFGF